LATRLFPRLEFHPLFFFFFFFDASFSAVVLSSDIATDRTRLLACTLGAWLG